MMNTKSLSERIDSLLLFAVTAVFGCAVVGYFSRNTAVIVTAGLACAVCVTAFVRVLRRKSQHDIDKSDYDATWLQFFAQSDAFCLDAVYAALVKRYAVERRDSYLVCNQTAIFLHFLPTPLPLERIFEVYKIARAAKNVQKLVILTAQGATPQANGIALQLIEPSISILDGEDVYRLLRASSSLPEHTVHLKKGTSGIRNLVVRASSPKAAKRYLLTALFLIGSSFLLPMPIYYLAGGSVCLVLAVVCGARVLIPKKRKPHQA